jgi:hypothetical protein
MRSAGDMGLSPMSGRPVLGFVTLKGFVTVSTAGVFVTPFVTGISGDFVTGFSVTA